jgi:hypothetical protein
METSKASASFITVPIFGFSIPPLSILIIVLYEMPDSTANFSCENGVPDESGSPHSYDRPAKKTGE